ncbi:DUF6126 family protein [Streptomyces sp. 796.1]|uniref:DUF6126 family protein n=1 Tax=Streptomyces sp. 796.1 TaxID=3163029 RepID=UPI0039C9BB4B
MTEQTPHADLRSGRAPRPDEPHAPHAPAPAPARTPDVSDAPDVSDVPAAAGKAVNEEDRAPWGLTIRVSFYLVGVHIFAAFLFLLFHLGAK